MLTFLGTSIGDDSLKIPSGTFHKSQKHLESSFCVLLTSMYKSINKNNILLQSLFNNFTIGRCFGVFIIFLLLRFALSQIRSLCHCQILEQIIEFWLTVFGLEIKNLLLLMMYHVVTYLSRKMCLFLLYVLLQQMDVWILSWRYTVKTQMPC